MPISALYFIIGLVLGGSLFWIYQRLYLGKFETLANQILLKTKLQEQEIKSQKMLELEKERSTFQLEFQAFCLQQKKEEEKLKKEAKELNQRKNRLDAAFLELKTKEELVKTKENKAQFQAEALLEKLEKVSKWSQEEAKTYLLEKLDKELEQEKAHLIQIKKKEAELEADESVKRILAATIQRLAVPCTSEATIQTVSLPSEEFKGRIIGKEGRNIRSFETLTGISLLLDETPKTIVLSGFDPIRMHTAKLALTELVSDGRIHPSRIEEAVEKAELKIQKLIKKYGEDAAIRAKTPSLHPELIERLGRLKFQFSFGQNMLEHSLEVSHLMGMIAAELGLDTKLARRIGLLHDIGKACTHEMEGSHAMIGHDLALKWGESQKVANGIGCHHQEIPPTTLEASFCSAADAISASRPKARQATLEEYIHRLKQLEEIAYSFPGVDKAYAIQAGKEVRVSVLPEKVNDQEMILLARDLTQKIEKELSYSGKIKITVIREQKTIQYAL